MTENNKQESLEWFLPDKEGNGHDGPFTTEDIIEMLDHKKLFYDDFIACPQYQNESWLRVYEFPHFKQKQKNKPLAPPPKLFSKAEPLPTVTSSSGDLMRTISEKVIIHNNQAFAHGQVHELAADYLHAEIPEQEPNGHFAKGDEVCLTIYDSNKMPSFSLQGVILDKKNHSGISSFKIYYLKINPEVRRKINTFLASES